MSTSSSSGRGALLLDPTRSVLWSRGGEHPGRHRQGRRGGTIAASFGAFTSGQVLLYDARRGALRFAGGITGARGHEGANAGRDALQSVLDEGAAKARAPVFGCSLFGDKT